VANNGSNNASVLLATARAPFSTHYEFGVGNGPMALALVDVNLDGKLDAAVVNRSDNSVSTLLGLASTQVTLTASPKPQVLGGAVTLTATASPVTVTGSATGTVSFFDGLTLLGASALVGGTAVCPCGPRRLAHIATARCTTATRGCSATRHAGRRAGRPDVRTHPGRRARHSHDQGGQVRVAWTASPYDADPPTAMDAYWVWRQSVRAAQAALRSGAPLMADDENGTARGRHALRAATFAP